MEKMNPEQLLEKLINNQITREEFEQMLGGLDDEHILARYEIYLQSQFEGPKPRGHLLQDHALKLSLRCGDPNPTE